MDLTVVSDNEEANSTLQNLGVKIVKKDPSAGPVDNNIHLAVGADLISKTGVVNNLAASLKQGGFILLEENVNITSAVVNNTGLELICKIPEGSKVFYLLRKVCLTIFT